MTFNHRKLSLLYLRLPQAKQANFYDALLPAVSAESIRALQSAAFASGERRLDLLSCQSLAQVRVVCHIHTDEYECLSLPWNFLHAP